ncbi:YolD-like family protein [Brevibacillus ginsengisoli]|uniref:YolD-like family protein n=1 Tax=Brevibacillus ginsengisoli TaxID=363854 RepID=UPI003CEEDC7F
MASKIDDPLISRFMLPEHVKALLELQEDKKLTLQPVLEDDELQSFQYQIMDAARNDYAITVTWWVAKKENLGLTCTFWGAVKWIDQQARRIKLVNDEDIQLISMDNIVRIETK